MKTREEILTLLAEARNEFDSKMTAIRAECSHEHTLRFMPESSARDAIRYDYCADCGARL